MSKTPKAVSVKIVSAHKKTLVIILISLLVVVGVSLPLRQKISCTLYHIPTSRSLQIGAANFSAETVQNESERERGLSGRPCIKDKQAMIFVFAQNDLSNHCFWMKDMRFPIDILWLDKTGKVIKIIRGLDPDTYPTSFCADSPSRYVLELKENTALRYGIGLGTVIKI